MEGSAFQLDRGEAKHDVSGAAVVGANRTVICDYGEKAFALRPEIVASISAQSYRVRGNSAHYRIMKRAFQHRIEPTGFSNLQMGQSSYPLGICLITVLPAFQIVISFGFLRRGIAEQNPFGLVQCAMKLLFKVVSIN